MNKLLSVIIITHNESARIRACLESVAFADEVLVLDSGSTDDTVAIAKSMGAQVSHSEDWPGFGPQKNRALQLATGQWVLSLNADERLTDQVLRRDVELRSLRTTDWLRLRLTGDVNKLTHLLYWPGAPRRVQHRFIWLGIRSCNFGVWYRDFEAVNGFDETFSGWGHEDADLVLRLRLQGCSRKNGALATEVFHLWHSENSRTGELANRLRVLARMKDAGPIRAVTGLAELDRVAGVVVSELNSPE